jgi:hypothetical protein
LLVRLLGLYFGRGLPVSVYVRGSFAEAEPIVGVSDIDLVVVGRSGPVGGDPSPTVLARRSRLLRLHPEVEHAVDVGYYPQTEIARLAATYLRYGLDDRVPGPLFHSRRNWAGLAFRPGLWPTRDWQLLHGSDLRPALDAGTSDHRRLAAWLELQAWWKWAMVAVAHPEAPRATMMCVKLIAEPARILLCLEHGERHSQRSSALHRALELLPEEHEAIRYVLELRRRLDRVPLAPLGRVLPGALRLTARIARVIEAELVRAGFTEVALSGSSDTGAMPLCDWPALCRPMGGASFRLVPGRPDDPLALAHAIDRSSALAYPTLVHDGLLVRPNVVWQGNLRTIAFAGSDPVSAALIRGDGVARFPEVPGWSADDTAARAVAEHRAWLRGCRPIMESSRPKALEKRLAGTLSAARAALLSDSLLAGEPALPLTFAATVEALEQQGETTGSAVSDAYGAYVSLRGHGVTPDLRTVNRAIEVVRGLRAYSVPAPPRLGAVSAPGAAEPRVRAEIVV